MRVPSDLLAIQFSPGNKKPAVAGSGAINSLHKTALLHAVQLIVIPKLAAQTAKLSHQAEITALLVRVRPQYSENYKPVRLKTPSRVDKRNIVFRLTPPTLAFKLLSFR